MTQMPPRLDELGDSGTRRSGGRITGIELNTTLQGGAWAGVCQQLMRTNPRLRAVWRVLLATLLSAEWVWVAGCGESRLAKRCADFANKNFGFDGHAGRMSTPWEVVLGFMLQFVPVGFRYAELVWAMGDDGNVWLDRIADRIPSSHYQWVPKDDGRGLAAVTQRRTFGYGLGEPIPAEKLLLLVHDQEGENYDGEGLARPAWWWANAQLKVADSMVIATERWGVTVPRIRVHYALVEELGWDKKRLDEEIDQKLEEAAAYVGGKPTSFVVDSDAVTWETYGGDLDPSGAIEVLHQTDRKTAEAFLAGFLDLGVVSAGARNVGETHSDYFRLSAVQILDYVAAEVSRQVMSQLCCWNFGLAPNAPEQPRLQHSGINVSHLGAALTALPGLVSSGVITPTAQLEAATLRTLRVSAGEGCDRSMEDRVQMVRDSNAAGAGRPRIANPGDHAPTQPPMPDGDDDAVE